MLHYLMVCFFALSFGGEPGNQTAHEYKLAEGPAMPYLLYLPEAYEDSEDTFPLMLFLHGRGESNGNLNVVKNWGPPRLIEAGKAFPYIVVSPQCPPEESWVHPRQLQGLLSLLDHLGKTLRVDSHRIYVTGLSMGGFGSWALAAKQPDRFAAIAPICGMGNPKDAMKLKGLPIWAFHGTDDRVIPIEGTRTFGSGDNAMTFYGTRDMVEAIEKAGNSQVRFTVLEHVGHFAWTAAYALPDLYRWLDQQSTSEPDP